MAEYKKSKVVSGVSPQTEIIKNSFSKIRQGIVTNSLTKLRVIDGQKAEAEIDNVTGAATITKGNLTLTMPTFAQLVGLKTSTYQLLDILTIILTETGAKSPTVILSLDEYMKRRCIKNRKEARKQLTADLAALLDFTLSWEEKRKGNSIPYAGVNMTDSWVWADAKKTAIVFNFGYTFYKVLLGYPIMPYPPQLQTLNSRKNPNSYYLLRKIAEHKNMNVGKNNEDTLSVKNLLEAAVHIPTYEEVMKGNRNITSRIIEPFERDMDALSDALCWHYCHSNGKELTEQELNNMTYDTFIKLLVKTSWHKYPDQTKRIERQAARIEANKNKPAKKRGRPPKKKAAED